MSLIQTVSPEQAEGPLAEIYRQLDVAYHGASQLAGDTLCNAFKIERDF